jgi:hypothetical protein
MITGIPRKTAESTGRLPPTPILHTVAREHSVIEFGEAPAERAKTPVMKRVKLKDSLWEDKKHASFRVESGLKGVGKLPASPDI